MTLVCSFQISDRCQSVSRVMNFLWKPAKLKKSVDAVIIDIRVNNSQDNQRNISNFVLLYILLKLLLTDLNRMRMRSHWRGFFKVISISWIILAIVYLRKPWFFILDFIISPQKFNNFFIFFCKCIIISLHHESFYVYVSKVSFYIIEIYLI